VLHQVPGLTDGIGSIVFAPDGKSFAATATGDVRVWDTVTGRETHRLPGDSRSFIVSLRFSPDGRMLAL
jgi:WD40 repeat protein